jgi:hypothetical protein
MARKPKNVEIMITLKEISGIESVPEFANACGKNAANIYSYLNGTKVPGKSVIKSALTSLYGWKINPLMEIQPIPKNISALPLCGGVYVLYDSGAQVIYVGKAENFRAEVRQTLAREIPEPLRFGPSLKKGHPKISSLVTHISLYEIPAPKVRHNIEALLLRVFANQTHNSNIGELK